MVRNFTVAALADQGERAGDGGLPKPCGRVKLKSAMQHGPLPGVSAWRIRSRRAPGRHDSAGSARLSIATAGQPAWQPSHPLETPSSALRR